MSTIEIAPEEIDRLYERLKAEAEAAGYHLHPDIEFTKELIRGLLINEKRYGYWACPCRLADGEKDADLDIICPCDYRDPDLVEFDACYCALYVSARAARGEITVGAIPDRRPVEEERAKAAAQDAPTAAPHTMPGAALPLPIWRCRVCGYLCAREEPPEVCPVCKAKRERFEKFLG